MESNKEYKGFKTVNRNVRFCKSGIKIKPENKGKFTSYCKSRGYNGVTSECIAEGKRSSNPTTRKRATFASNARRFKH